MKKRVAILIDGDFYIRKYMQYFKKTYPTITLIELSKDLYTHCMKHIRNDSEELYRIFFYDCKPITKKVHKPITNQAYDLSKTEQCIFRTKLHKILSSKPCLSLRFGYLDENNATWKIKSDKLLLDIIKGKKSLTDLEDKDFIYYAKQKGVDMRIGLDISTLSLKKQVERIVLISGDSDFVPAAKLARREGIIFTLDPMGNPIREDLNEHIDFLKTTLPNYFKNRNNI
ncbi:helicase [Campylobacter fetus subsp. testudinum]|uniref:NYN domain-containing protein n=1 Tax=Campylobacter fetus TaxID=196 RepID=UPI0008187E54|nr:NYN domain-containing protein [Campylobacter fetus]OCR88048.1 helicase [Campylobacter fetus subsp. testudinum]